MQQGKFFLYGRRSLKTNNEIHVLEIAQLYPWAQLGGGTSPPLFFQTVGK